MSVMLLQFSYFGIIIGLNVFHLPEGDSSLFGIRRVIITSLEADTITSCHDNVAQMIMIYGLCAPLLLECSMIDREPLFLPKVFSA